MGVYVEGQVVRIQGTFAVDGTPTAPTTYELKVKRPDGTVDTYTSGLTNPSTGVYYKDYTATWAGTYWYRLKGTGAVEAIFEGRFVVDESQVI